MMRTVLSSRSHLILELIPVCTEDFVGVCVEQYDQGYVVYPEHNACQDSWLLLPGFYLLPNWILGLVFLLTLFYCFFGVSLAADQFCAGIEEVTGTTFAVTVKGSKGQDLKTRVPVWNPAVANLTLMAVGTSAPEILLATIETLTSLGKPAGELGPACIVGSAAYNLLVISAVCIVARPDGTYKKIDEFRVFLFTAACSLWAYVWMIICYSIWTPDVITLGEGILTLIQFPIMAVLAWAIDNRIWLGYKVVPDDQLAELEAAQRTGSKEPKKRVKFASARRYSLNRKSVDLSFGRKDAAAMEETQRGVMTASALPYAIGSKTAQVVNFQSYGYAAARAAGHVRLTVTRDGGDLLSSIMLHYSTRDHDAVGGVDYERVQGQLQFSAGDTYKFIDIRIANSHAPEDPMKFFVRLRWVDGDFSILKDEVEVSIIDEADPGVVCFPLPKYKAYVVNDTIEVIVERRHGTHGTIAAEISTCDETAKAGVDYTAARGMVTFAPFEARNLVRLPLYGMRPGPGRAFRLTLTAVQGWAKLGKRTQCQEFERIILPTTWMEIWMCQLKEAIQPKYDEDEMGEPIDVDMLSCIIQYVSITWKVLMSVVPPADYKGGYPCFFVALFFVAGITALTEQAANLFGCAVGMSKLVTGVSLVAVGTSLPDTFASRYAAMSAPNADAAIGNITGSNSVNVFLGLGLPWVIATMYQHMKGEVFLAPAGDLTFSIIVFMPLGAFTLALLMVRRFYLGGELGGTRLVKQLTAAGLTALWLLYLILSGLRDTGNLA